MRIIAAGLTAILLSSAAQAQVWGPGPPPPPDPYYSGGPHGTPPLMYYYTTPPNNNMYVAPQPQYQAPLFGTLPKPPCIPRNLITGAGCN